MYLLKPIIYIIIILCNYVLNWKKYINCPGLIGEPLKATSRPMARIPELLSTSILLLYPLHRPDRLHHRPISIPIQ